jgi:hypothetical protein
LQLLGVVLVSLGQRSLSENEAEADMLLGGTIFPIFVDRVAKLVGFDGAVRYTALFIGILLAMSCFLVKARLPRKKWNREAKWFDLALFKKKPFALYVSGSYLVMFVISRIMCTFNANFTFRWGLWAPLAYLPGMAVQTGFSTTMGLYLISILKSVVPSFDFMARLEITGFQCIL